MELSAVETLVDSKINQVKFEINEALSKQTSAIYFFMGAIVIISGFALIALSSQVKSIQKEK